MGIIPKVHLLKRPCSTRHKTRPPSLLETKSPLSGVQSVQLASIAKQMVQNLSYTKPPVIYTVAAWANAGTVAKVGCTISAYRTVIVVDSMPDTLAAASTGADIEMDIYGAKGSCSVSETVKGTYESDVCSSRGNCDGASGLCTCHEGYSGEACETQTVLV